MLVLMFLAQAAQPLTDEQFRACRSTNVMMGAALPAYCPREKVVSQVPQMTDTNRNWFCFVRTDGRGWLISDVVVSRENRVAIEQRFSSAMRSSGFVISTARCQSSEDRVVVERWRQDRTQILVNSQEQVLRMPFR
ncbi:hypothetical protein GCM10022281_21410 [Sphingomonas rosea]|uniref:DUF3019 domain-containing protein n=1 Tax=Sphingomonas rosea TaxID=335605 RepID=A0ABP7UCF0_9SPHN